MVDEEIEFEIAKYFLSVSEKLKKNSSRISYVNNIFIESINSTQIEFLQSQNKLVKNLWKISNTYRLITMNQFDEECIWYVMDELGTFINHSDKPNVVVIPFIFSKSNQFNDDMMTYSIMWPIDDIYTGSEIYRDFLLNINEQMQRSARLTTWFQTPREYFLNKFEENSKLIEKLTQNSTDILLNYDKGLKKLNEMILSQNKTKNEIFNEIDKIFDFKLLDCKIKEDKLPISPVDRVKDNIINSITLTNLEKSELNSGVVYKVFTDIHYVRDNLNLKNFEITTNIEEADIIWINFVYHTIKANNMIYYHDFVYPENEKPSISLKPIHFKNQFPFESIVTHKRLFMNLIQEK